MIKRVLEGYNMQANEEVVKKVLQEVKDLSSQTGKCVTSDQIIKMVGEFNGKSN
jgi:isopropylmalate/homocitrate/citramalate synthase